MSLIATLATPYAIGFDSEPFSEGGTRAQADALRAWGMRFFCGYLGPMTPARLADVIAAGLAFMPVTFAARFDGLETVQELERLGVPHLTTVWLDLEAITSLPPDMIIAKCNMWGRAVRAAGFDPGIYCGAGFQLTSAELGALTMDRYWLGGSDPLDRNGELARPYFQGPIGWTLEQLVPLEPIIAGVKVDVNVIKNDFKGRRPLWCVAQ